MRKQITIGLTSGKGIVLEVLDKNVEKIIKKIKEYKGEGFVDLKPLLIQKKVALDVLEIKPSTVEMFIVTEVPPVPSNIAVPARPGPSGPILS